MVLFGIGLNLLLYLVIKRVNNHQNKVSTMSIENHMVRESRECDLASTSSEKKPRISLPKYIGRIAPSPSGHLHIGHAQTFSVARDRAHNFKGDLLLRVEDIDVQRCKSHFLTDMIEDLQWFGLDWNRGYSAEASSSSTITSSSSSSLRNEFVQSKRFSLYEKAWRILYERGYLYPCRLSRKDVDLALSAPHDNVSPQIPGSTTYSPPLSPTAVESGEVIFPPYLRPDFVQRVEYGTGNCCHFPPEYKGLLSPLQPLPPLPSEKNNGVGQYKTVNWRFRVPEKADERAISFDDVYFGQQTFHGGIDFGDFLIWRSDGYPSYELAVVVDDIIMGVREVVRGQDLLLSTARQLLVIKALFGLDYRDEKCWWPAFPRDHLRWSIEHCDMLLEEYSQMEKEEEISEQDMLSLESTKFRIPRYFHCPLVLDEHGKRMAKRNFSKGLRKLREEGVSPEDIKRKYFNSTLCRVSG